MPPKRKAVRRQREDPSSSTRQPHHVMTQPVFLQKILPFAATSHLSPITFKSVSSSWLETQIHYSGEILCWKAFYEQSEKSAKTTHRILDEIHSSVSESYFRDNRDKEMEQFYYSLAEPILKMSALLSEQQFQSLLERDGDKWRVLEDMFCPLHVKGISIVLDAIEFRDGTEGLKTFFRHSPNYLLKEEDANFLHHLCECGLSEAIQFVCHIMRDKVGEEFLKENLQSTFASKKTPLMRICGSEYASGNNNGIFIYLLRLCQDLGKEFLTNQLQAEDKEGKTVLMILMNQENWQWSPPDAALFLLCSTLDELGIFGEQFESLNEGSQQTICHRYGLFDAQPPPQQNYFGRVFCYLYVEHPFETEVFLNEIKLILSERSAADQVFDGDFLGDNALIAAAKKCNTLPIIEYLFTFVSETYGKDRLKEMLEQKNSSTNALQHLLDGYGSGEASGEPTVVKYVCDVLKSFRLFTKQLNEIRSFNLKAALRKLIEAKVLNIISRERQREMIEEKKKKEAKAAKEARRKLEMEEKQRKSAATKVAPKTSAGKKAASKKQVYKKQKSRANKAAPKKKK